MEDPRQRRFFKWNDLKELFQIPPAPPGLSDVEIDGFSPQYRSLLHRVLGQATAKHREEENVMLSAKALWEKELLERDELVQSERMLTLGYDSQISSVSGVDVPMNEIDVPMNETDVPMNETEAKIPKKGKILLTEDGVKQNRHSVKKEAKDDIKRGKRKRHDVFIETEVAAFETFGNVPKSQYSLVSQKTKKEHNMILETLLDQEGIQVRGRVLKLDINIKRILKP